MVKSRLTYGRCKKLQKVAKSCKIIIREQIFLYEVLNGV